jgi:hypothetical protein
VTSDARSFGSIAVSAALAALPIGWTVWHRGRRRRREREGALDGVLLLAALLCSAIALTLAVVALLRLRREARERAEWPTVTAIVDRCTVASSQSGGRSGGLSHELSCVVRFRVGERVLERTVSAGYPARRSAYDRWIAQHPPGTTIRLRHGPTDPTVVTGLSQLVPSTTTGAAAAARALAFAAAGCILFVGSRLAARRRGSHLPPPGS